MPEFGAVARVCTRECVGCVRVRVDGCGECVRSLGAVKIRADLLIDLHSLKRFSLVGKICGVTFIRK